jgi:flagellar hook-associated protein 3 FlgL
MSGSVSNAHRNVSYALALHTQDLNALQEKVATGAKVNRVSDGPSIAFQLLSLESQKRSLANYEETLTSTVSTMDMTTTVLEAMATELRETKATLTQIAGGIHGQTNRNRIAETIDDQLEQIVLLANSQHGNQYLFGGAKTSTLPFAVTRDTANTGEITAVTYQGSQDQRSVEVAQGVTTDVYWVGVDMFREDNRGDPTFLLENTGAAEGSGTSSTHGDVWLEVTHDGTNYQLSIDGGTTKTTVPLVGDVSNVAVTDSNGDILYVDASNITETGTDVVTIPGSYDLFDILISIRDILRNEANLPEYQLQEVLQDAIGWTGEISEQLLQQQVAVGSQMGYLDDLKETIDNMEFNIEEETTQINEADIAQLSIDLARRSVLYEMSLSVAGKLMSVSLLDFLR